MSYDDLRRMLQEDAEIATGCGARSDEIAEAERVLEVRFPAGYRRFLEDFGWFDGYDDRVFGLGADVPSIQDLVRETRAGRHEFRPYLPHGLIPLYNDGAGNISALDTRRSAGEAPVVVWDHEFDERQDPEIDEESGFVAWLHGLIERGRERS